MSKGEVCRTRWVGAFVVGLMLALAVPSIALAANTATFSSRTPAPHSWSNIAKPTISVVVYDRYGVTGGHYSLYLDGVKTAATISRYSGYGYRKFKLSYAVPVALSNAVHKVKVNVRDRQNHLSTTTWYFGVDTIAPVTVSTGVLPGYPGLGALSFSATDGGTGVAHTYWTLDNGAPMEGPVLVWLAVGSHHVDYWSVDKVGNVETPKTVSTVVTRSHALPTLGADASCIVAGCHGGTGDVASLHGALGCINCHGGAVGPSNDCQVCHGATNPPPNHATHAAIHSSAAGTATDCQQSQCHGSSLMGPHASCATCHQSTDPTVVAAIASGHATCEDCHDIYADTHTSANASHVVSGACFTSTCHGTDVTKMHTTDFRGTGALPPGCAACHGAGKTPSTNCTSCHTDIVTPHNYAAAHAVVQPKLATNSIACVACHGSNIMAVLPAGNDVSGVAEHVGCSCHAYLEARGKTACQGCHNGAHAPHGFVNGFSHGEGWIAASGHNTTTLGRVGAYSKFDGSQGPVIKWESEIASSSLNATWLVEAGFQAATRPLGITSVTVGQEGTMTTTWDLPTAQVFWSSADTAAPASAIKGLSWTSVIACTDCHSGLLLAGPHGANDDFGIDSAYPGDYSMAELTKYVTANVAFVSATLAGQSLDTTVPVAGASAHLVYLKSGYSVPPAAGDWLKADDPACLTSLYFTSGPLSASGIAMRPGVDGDGVVRNIVTFDPQTTGSVGATVAVYDLWDIRARTNGTSGSSAVICAKCHDLENQVPLVAGASVTATTPVVGSNTAHNSHHQDQADGSAQCVSCHVGIPHGWKRPRLLVNTDVDVAPYFDPASGGVNRSNGWATAYRWNGSTWVATATGFDPSIPGTTTLYTGAGPNPGFTRMGMRSLSAVDNHIAIKNATDPNVFPAAGLNTVNTDDMIYWSEAGCQACNDHGGEDGIRILETE